MEIDYNNLPKKAIVKKTSLVEVLASAKSLGYLIEKVDYNTGLFRFVNGGIHINFYCTSFTITTELNHPKKGKTQLHRRNLTTMEVREIFKNPRKHTGQGYYKK